MSVWLAIIINSVLELILLIISGYWACHFIKRIYSLRRNKRREVSYISDYDNNEQLHYNYETDIWRYTLLLVIIACEVITSFLSIASDTFRSFLTLHNVTNTTVELPYSECISYHKPGLKGISLFYTVIPYLHGISTIKKSAEIFLIAFTIHLMNYLIARMKNIKLANSRRFFLLTVLWCAVLIMTGLIESATILNMIFVLIFGFVYICIFIRTSKRFKRALLQRAMECLIQHRSRKQAMKEYTATKLYINILCCGYLLMFISETVITISSISVSILFFGNCYFPSNLFPSLSYVLQTEEEMEFFLEGIKCVYHFGSSITYISLFVIWLPMLCITIYFLIKPIRECFSSNKNIKYRVSESSLKYLLVYN